MKKNFSSIFYCTKAGGQGSNWRTLQAYLSLPHIRKKHCAKSLTATSCYLFLQKNLSEVLGKVLTTTLNVKIFVISLKLTSHCKHTRSVLNEGVCRRKNDTKNQFQIFLVPSICHVNRKWTVNEAYFFWSSGRKSPILSFKLKWGRYQN